MADTLKTIQQIIDPSEKILWHAAAGIWATARRQFGFQMIVIVGFIGFGLFFFRAFEGPRDPFILIFQTMWFGLLGFALLAPLWAGIAASRTAYAITDRRAVIVSGLIIRRVKSFTAQNIGTVERVERVGGNGSLRFQSTMMVADSEGAKRPVDVGFFGIANVRQVEKLLLDLKPPA